jgi:glycerate 2-kinase
MTAAAPLVVLVAPDSFKGSLPADQVAAAVGAGCRTAAAAAGVPVDVVLRPVADGGEGTVAMVLAAGWRRREVTVRGPTGAPVVAVLALGPVGASPPTAVVELAAASGLGLLPGGRPDPLGASTYGTGQLVGAALDAGAERLVLGIGGSATTDGGTGLAAALGARFLDRAGVELRPGGGALVDLAGIDVSGLDPRLRTVEVVVASDVDNPLTGPKGAAHVYAPQKGAAPDDVALLDAGLVRLAEVLRTDLGTDVDGVPGAGAAGGVGAGALAFLGARLTPGIDLLLDLVGFDDALTGIDLVVTGEGSVDAQTLSGKAPLGVARRARAAGVPVVLLAGRADLDGTARATLRDLGVVGVHTLLEIEPDATVARRDAARLLEDLAARAFQAFREPDQHHDHGHDHEHDDDLPTRTTTRSPA